MASPVTGNVNTDHFVILFLVLASLLHVSECQVQFNSSAYNPTLPEEQPVGTYVVTIGASYFDSFGIPRTDGVFNISTIGDAQYFRIDTSTALFQSAGTITTVAVFDRDAPDVQTVFVFDVTYTTPVGTSESTQVRVTLSDLNDNSPRFTERVFTTAVFEGTRGGTPFFNVTAVDPDLVVATQTIDEASEDFGELEYTVANGRIIYNITGGNELGHFSINADNGTLSVSLGAVLDVDSVDLYNLTVMAVDGGGLKDTATVIVSIVDSNDNQPQILAPHSFQLTISEDTPLGFVILESINATDADTGINADIRFLITSGDITNSFLINEHSGEILVSSPLDRERGEIVNLTIAARDRGIPPQQDTFNIVIYLLDVNDFVPSFSQTSYELSINEGSIIGARVGQVEAVDNDQGPNGTVTYRILEDAEGKFAIDSQTGEIFTNGSLDREQVPSYTLLVEAVDNPDNSSLTLSSVVNVTVIIEDVNDNSPIFEQESYEVSILDNVRRFTEIIQLRAFDQDSGSNGRITYRFEVPDPTMPNDFNIDADTGIVSRIRRVVFEEQSVYSYTIRALDNGEPFPLHANVQLTIYVHNVNENPPVFEHSEYNTTIVETTAVGSVVLNVIAHDPDTGLIGEVRYRIVSVFDAAGSFEVNETTGDIYVNSTLDFDFRDTISFQVEAYDGGFPEPFTDIANITIFLIGENDEAPSIIFPEDFQIFVPENEPPVIEIINLSQYTFDPDFGSGGEFEFGISQIYDTVSQNDSFAINASNGLITSLRIFDREEQPQGIIVTIETTDFGRIPQSKVTNITILIGDKNDQSPYFETNTSTTVYEFMPPGEQVLAEYKAIDDDIGSNAQLRYEIFAGDEFRRFSINSQTGGIYTAQVLNKTVQKYYNLTIIALDQGIPQMHGFGEIFVEVLDANDQTPIFTEPVYSVSFPETSPIGTTFLQVNATDSDVGTNAEFQYFLAPNSSHSNRFEINITTGEVYTTDMFDRENESSIELTVLAIDFGVVPLTGTGMIQIYINDSNDNSPFFNETVYRVQVTENAPVNTCLLFVLAYDLDAESPNNVIKYTLRGDRSEVFRVDPNSGELFVDGEVDWEEGANFTIVVIATDLGDPAMSAEAEIMILIEDVNDRPPVFMPSSLNLSIFENSEPGVVVGFVEAIDPDSSGNNSDVSYSVRMDFTNGMFQLDEETGLVTFANGVLNREVRGSYDLLIRASDHGSPQQYSDAVLIISVLDANDFDPVFDRSFYFADVAENVPVGTSFLTVHATDMDVGTNAELRYTITHSLHFAINASTGAIYTIDRLDFENMISYTFDVFVTDLGSPPRNATTTATVTIFDFNDNFPVFEQSEYSARLRENLASGTTVLRVSTTDLDSGTNAVVEYSLKEGEGSSYFGIDPETGVLYSARYINREETPRFNLTVIANNSAAGSPLFSEVQAVIEMTDLNDMHPSFDVVTEIFVAENTTVNSTIYTLSARDGDEGLNGTVTYAIHQGNEQGIFHLNPDTGGIVLLRELDFEVTSLYLFSVVANDSGSPSLSNYTNVLVRVLDSNDNRPYFTSPEYRITVSSEVSVGTTVVTVAAFDNDVGLNGELTYTITSGNNTLFELASPRKGTIKVASLLRTNAGQNFTLTIQASDVNFSETCTVIVYAQEGISTLPRFSQLFFTTSILESASIGTTVFTFSSRTTNARRLWIERGDAEGFFSIDAIGTITLASAQLDFEERQLYQLTIGIENSAGESAFTVLNVSINDANEFGPEFISNVSFIAIPETIPTNEPFFTMIATDRDGGTSASVITYSLIPPDNTFQINSQTGELSLRRALNYELGDRNFAISVRATNGIFSTETTVEILVLNGNSYPPVFSQRSYPVMLDEDASVGLNIVNVSASDQDTGSQGEITYGLHGDHRYLDFSIDTYTGQIFINHPLDYERQTLYTLEVVASDGGNPNLFEVASVRVAVVDLNDNDPIWDQVEYVASILENATVGTTLIQVSASDADQVDISVDGDQTTIFNRNGYVTYSITDGDPDNQFHINPDTGVITIAFPLNREERPEYMITLNATDGGGRFANAFLNVTVHDINDQVPAFDQSHYLVSLPENSNNGTLVIQVAAQDTDLNQNSVFEYGIEDGNINDTFLLNSSTGEIWLDKPIDRETIQSYTLTVVAVDMGIQPLTGTTQVQVNVLDINEYMPQFDQESYSRALNENTPVMTSILQVSAYDLDFGENATILFSIITGNELGLFDVNSSTGILYVSGSIDFEEDRKHDLVVMAIDSGPPSERLSSEVNVTISVLDENDNRPQFSEERYTVYVSEAAAPGEIVLNVNVTDADTGTNAEFAFFLDFQGSLESENNFVIESATGTVVISNTSSLDHETTLSYSLLINVTDLGDPPLQSSVPMLIVITDSNDNYPQFVQGFFDDRLDENMPPGTSAAQVTATDADEGSNADISYKVTSLIQNEAECISECRGAEFCSTVFTTTQVLPTTPPFYTNSETGVILSAKYFDRENISSYVVVVTASDSSENGTQLSNTTCVHIAIQDQNDQYPLFNRTIYSANITENTPPMTAVIQVLASDDDISTNAEVRYQLLTETGSFTINPSTGEIFSLRVFDREATDVYNLTVEVTDRGEPALSTTAMVEVIILDENDSPPVFSEPFYLTSIREDVSLGSQVLLLNVTDMDINENAEITFSIEASIPANHFNISPLSGLLQTTQPLDRENIPSYVLTIRATDAGSPPLSSETQVNITILDVNDLAPEFIGVPYTAQVEENTLPVYPIESIQAQDGDLGTNAEVFFSLTAVYPESTAFVINTTSGEVSLRATLDAEASLVYNLTIVTSNGPALPEQQTEAIFTIEVLDKNDITPQFQRLDLVVTISEAVPIGYEVTQLLADDLDITAANSELTYQISGGHNTSLFGIDLLSGTIYVAGILDRELEPEHLLEVTVSDSGVPTLNSTTTVTIVLQDSNDNSPVFEQRVYLFSIQENLPNSTVIGRIRAYDIDQDNVSYFLPDNGSLDGSFFLIDPTSGEIISAAVFDREVQDLFSFVAIATDNGVGIVRTAEVVVNVTILDENDVAPEFSENVYNVSWYENTTVGTILITVEAFDPDLGRNGTIAYSIISSNDSSFFSINSTSGEIYLYQQFDREIQDWFEINVTAHDFGFPSLTGTAVVQVQVLDNNDNVPILNASEYRATLLEDTPVGTTAIYTGASDEDINENANLYFSLSEDFNGTFSIAAETGILTLTKSLDYELFQNYSFSVIVRDNGENPLQSSSAVLIDVVDLNDNPPVFDSDVYSVSVPENAILNTPIFQIPATDSDSTSNSELRYSILAGNLQAKFAVDETSGVISVGRYLDREITPFYTLSLQAVDSGIPQFTASAMLEISISDVNDHPPQFNSKIYSVSVPENTTIGTTVLTVSAEDADSNLNANLSFTIGSENSNGTFEVDSTSGAITVTKALDFETTPAYALTVFVTDNGKPLSLSDTTTVRILITDTNEHPPMFAQSSYTVSLSEDAVVGTPIGYFIAADMDVYSETCTYSLREEDVPFTVDPLSGTVYVSGALQLVEYNLTLIANDGAYNTFIDIKVQVSSSTPVVIPPSYYFEISEAAELNTTVGMLPAMNVTSQSLMELFEVSENGRISLIGELNREHTLAYVFNVIAEPGTSSSVYHIVTIYILDYNDMTPVFESSEYTVLLPELTRIGTTVLALKAFDIDPSGENSDFQISISSGNEGNMFALNIRTGALTVARMMDYEGQNSFTLTANVTNHLADPELYSTTQIHILVTDINDNDPRFSQAFYQARIPESTPIGSEIIILNATDIDSGTNSALVFAITHLSVPNSFTINQTTGAIATNMILNLSPDMNAVLEISAMVADRGNPRPRSDVTTIFVEVVPDNFHPPLFSQPEGYATEIPETLAIGSSILQLVATDPDSLSLLAVTFSIQSGNSQGKFEIDPSSGLITLASDLDFLYEPFFSLAVEAVDFGTPSRSSRVGVNISVIDINNHDPQFDQVPYEVAIFENVTVHSSVVQVHAVDPDAVSLTYILTVNAFENGTQLFGINSTTGEIYTTAPIDREFANSLQLLVSAIDSGYPIQRSQSVPVTVNIQDVNDNAPEFEQQQYTFEVLRFLSPGQLVGSVTATDADLVGLELEYSITVDNSGGLFEVDSSSGELATILQVPEAEQPSQYEFTVTVYDGVFTTGVPVHIQLITNGSFCEDGGFCTNVSPRNCTFDIFPFTDCNPFCVRDYELSPGRMVCLSFHCIDAELVPCNTTKSCILYNEACAGVCPVGMSVCPTTNICHISTLSDSCDGSNETCLIGQTLVQRVNGTRYCTLSESLPTVGQTCVGERNIYCEALDECSNISAPDLCQACPNGLFQCPDTNECLPNPIQCCGFTGYYCEVLNVCLNASERCELPNIAPVIQTDLIYLETVTFFDADAVESGDGHVIGLLLGNGTHPGIDSQGEELSVAIVGISQVPAVFGEWQYSLCNNTHSDLASACSGISSTWITIGIVSETNALILPNTAQIRFVRKIIEFDGAVWMRVKLWDGNPDGYLSAEDKLVRTSDPHFNSTIPFSRVGPYSEQTTLITVLIQPLIQPPTFNRTATLQFSEILEDVHFVNNRGNTLADIVASVQLPDFRVLPEDRIEGFPDIPQGAGFASYEALLPNNSRVDYFNQVRRVNPTRMERQRAIQSGQYPGVGVSFDAASRFTGVWQVSRTGDTRQFIYLNSVINTTNQILLLNTTARLRYLPDVNFCGEVSIPIRPWDGFWNETLANRLENGYIVTSPPDQQGSLSSNNLNDWEQTKIRVSCVPDQPVISQNRIVMDPIPYRIMYRYEALFTALVAREVNSFKTDRERFSDSLQLILQQSVDIKRFSPANSRSAYVSFSVENASLSFEDVRQLVLERGDTLTQLNFQILELSQDASYGSGAGCPTSEAAQHYHGTLVNTLISQVAFDSDNDYLGMAVVADNSLVEHGIWQYYRGNWGNSSSQYDANSSIWLNFPSRLSETRAFLLHGNDRIRFLPRPGFYWQNISGSANLPPSVRVKVWDNTIGNITFRSNSEILLMNINTDPFADTLQSLTNPVGLFSDSSVTIEAARYGCDHIVNSGLTHDACCTCGGDGANCMGCNQQRGSNTIHDACDVCGGDDTSCLGCDLIPFSSIQPGPCRECISTVSLPLQDVLGVLFPYPTSSFLDCNGQCYGGALTDECGVCSGGESSHRYNSDKDCTGECFGTAVIDDCGECTGGDTALLVNQNLDCTGICGGPFVADSCGICQLPDEDGSIVENRDCAGICFGEARLDVCGVCYGGTTGIGANVTIDSCGICSGDNSTCIGCDGVVNSNKIVDRCGSCGGNNCGCFQIDFISPTRGPRTGGTIVTVHGAGFFLNDSSLLRFNFSSESENCGAPNRDPFGESIPVTCLFTAQAAQQLQAPATVVDQDTIRCLTESSARFNAFIPAFSLQVRVGAGRPFSNAVTFYYDDYSEIRVFEVIPNNTSINQNSTVLFVGQSFLNSSVSACRIYSFTSCIAQPRNTEDPVTIPMTYINSSVVSCQLPAAERPCRVAIRLSFDGQESGTEIPGVSTGLQFTYMFSAPEIQSIYFSNDLSRLIIQFDRQVETIPGTPLSCQNIISEETHTLIGGFTSSCYWSDNRQKAISVSLPPLATVQIGSEISFIEGVIQTRGQLYSYTVPSLPILVDESLNAVRPIAILTGPHSIPACGRVNFTAANSLYPGYGGFRYSWSVFVEDSSIEGFETILTYLDSLSLTSVSISLDVEVFASNMQYYLELYVVNSIGLQSEPQIRLLEKDSGPLPQVYILGSSERVIYPGESVLVESQVNILQCAAAIELSFNWQLFRILDKRRQILAEEDLSDVHSQSADILIPAEYFTTNTSYTLRLTVRTAQDSSIVNITIEVLPYSLQARIHGGDRIVSQNRTVVLDARASQLIPNAQNASFVWSCNTVGLLGPCYNQSESLQTPIAISFVNFTTIPAKDLQPGRIYNFTLRLTQESFTSFASATIEIASTRPPIVEILVPTSEFLSSQPLTLQGLVYSNLSTEDVHWECLQLLGQSYIDINDVSVVQSQTFYPSAQQISSQTIDQYSGIPLAVSVFANEISRVNLVLKPNVLIPGERYTFRLSATNSEGTAYSQILVTADPPPQYAMMLAEPLSGLALETNFVFTVSGAIDYTTDSPFLYQFGLIEEQSLETNSSDQNVKWISGVQTSNSINTVLPSGNSTTNYSIRIRGRIFDRKGGYSDVQTQIAVRPNTATGAFYGTVLTDIKATFDYNKDWATALSRLMATVLDINRNTGVALPQTLKDEALDIFMNIFNEHLPATQSHYALAASLLDQITSDRRITGISNQRRIAEALTTVVNWFKSQTAIQATSTEVPSLRYGEPLLLQSTYEAMPKNLLTTTIVQSILSSWVNVLQSQITTTVAQTFVQNTESISYTLCQQSILGENATVISIPLADLYVKSAPPVGAFNISSNLVDFGSSLLPVYRLQACNNRNTACSETCFQGIRYPSDFFADPDTQTIRLSTTAMERLLSEIEGSDPSSVTLFSDVTSAVISVPSMNSFLEVRNLGTPIQVLVQKQQPVPNDGSRVLCLYRPVGGSNGFDSFEWQLDTLTAPMITTVNSTEYFVCEFTHLSEFAVGLLAPPVITQAPILTTSASQIQPSSSSHTPVETPSMVTQETPTQPRTMVPVAGFPAPAIAIPLVLIIVVAIVAALAVVLCLMWKKKRQKKLKVSPEERPESPEASPHKKAKLIKAGPLTPEESKVPMDIIQLLDSGERTVVGTMNVLPSIRLRELRYQLGDHFGAFKNKPFYFLNRQLCEIEPAAEQQQFVSLVFGDKPIYVRKVTNNNEQIRHHFCICGNAAQFECSNCSSQGYCSTECQYKDWSEQHQKECSRLSEKRRRSEILLRRQSSILSPDETPRRATIAGPPSVETQPTSPTDWKTFLSSSKPMRQQSMNLTASLPRTSVVQQDTPRTTLGQIAAQAPPSTIQEGAIGQRETPVDMSKRPIVKVPSVGAYSVSKRQLPPLSRQPSIPRTSGLSPYQSPPRGAFASPIPSMTPASPLYSTTEQPLFTRPDLRHIARATFSPGRQLSIHSVGSDDFMLASLNRPRDIRNEPLLETDEDNYESSRSTESESQPETPRTNAQETRASSVRTNTRPPSLTVRKRSGHPSQVSKAFSQSESETSSSSSGSESDELSSGDDDSQLMTPASTGKRPASQISRRHDEGMSRKQTLSENLTTPSNRDSESPSQPQQQPHDSKAELLVQHGTDLQTLPQQTDSVPDSTA